MQTLLVNQSPVSSITYSNKMRVIYDGVEQDAELRKYPSGKIYFRTENAHFVPVNEVGVLIPLTQGKNAIVDFEDYERIMAMGKWHYTHKGYASKRKDMNGHSFMHRVIMNAPKNAQVDHIWGNRLDNRKENLRICTNSQNQYNSRIQKNNKSGYKGVSWHKKNKKWKAKIQLSGRDIHLGYFICPIEAAKAYNKSAIENYGEFAWLNKIPNG